MAKKCKEIGKMRHRLVIEKPVLVSDDAGGQTETWETFAEVWGSLDSIKAWQAAHAETLEGRVTHKSKVRYIAGITIAMRISFDSRIFQIKGVKDPDETKRFLIINSEEGAVS